MTRPGDSFAGITVPEGEPEVLEQEATKLEGCAEAIATHAEVFKGLPSSIQLWGGPASVAYAEQCLARALAMVTVATSTGEAGAATRRHATVLEQTQGETTAAIDHARDAQKRIDEAQAEVAAAEVAAGEARARADRAVAAAYFAQSVGLPATEAVIEEAAANADETAAEERGAAAGRRLDEARADLEVARRRGARAKETYEEAAPVTVAGFDAAAQGALAAVVGVGGTPVLPGAPGSASPLLRDLFGAFDVRRGENARDVTLEGAGETVEGYADWRSQYTHVAGYWRGTSGGGHAWVQSHRRGLATTPDGQPGRTSRRWSAIGTGAKVLGPTADVALEGYDQWQADAPDQSLTGTDRIGRAMGVGLYVGAAGVAGAAAGAAGGAALGGAIGSVVPGPGTIAGAGVGAVLGGVGGFVGGIAASDAADDFTAGKQWAVEAGQDVANGVADGAAWAADKAGEVLDELTPW